VAKKLLKLTRRHPPLPDTAARRNCETNPNRSDSGSNPVASYASSVNSIAFCHAISSL
jgi:hypothetical protein